MNPGTNLAPLPDDWNTLDLSEQIARMMQMCTTTSRDLHSLTEQMNALTTNVLQNTVACARNTAEIDYLKNIQSYAKPIPELIVTGIPATTTISMLDVINRILCRLKLENLTTDILDIRQMNKKNLLNTTTAQRNSIVPLSPNNTISIIVKFKSVDIRNFIIDAKRKVGKITVAEIFTNTIHATSQGTIFVNEFLPSSTYTLYREAKKKAHEKNYTRVWVRNGSIYVRKDDGSKEIPIITSNDLNKLQ